MSFFAEGWRQYNCNHCGAPVKLTRKGWGSGSNEKDPNEYKFDGVDLSPQDCAILVAVLWAHGPIPNGIYEKLTKRASETPEPGARP